MRILFLVLLFNCFVALQVKAQSDEDILSRELKINSEVKEVLKQKKLAKCCTVALNQYKTDLSAFSKNEINKTIAAKLINVNKKFTGLAVKSNFVDSCNTNKDIKKITDDATEWTAVLQSYINPPPAKADTITLRFKISDANGKTLPVAFGLEKPVTDNRVIKLIPDTGGYFTVSLLPVIKTADSSIKNNITPNLSSANIRVNVNTASQVEDDGFMHRYPSVAIVLTLVILLLICVCYFFLTGKFVLFNKVNPVFINSDGVQPKPVEISKQTAVISPIAEPVKATGYAYFDFEVLMTAGPRKKLMSQPDSDIDLGEDVCGGVVKNDQVLFWLLDGTSDLDFMKNAVTKREYFSSRLLAQAIAIRLKSAFQNNKNTSIDQLVLQILAEVRSYWLADINALPDNEKNILKDGIKEHKFLECATTVIIATLNINGHLLAYRSGDSKMFLYHIENGELKLLQSTLSDKNDDSNDRVFFRLIYKEDAFDILFNKPLFEIVNEKNINAIIACSDGIGQQTEQILKKQYGKSPDTVREEISYQLQGTADDKSIGIIQIKEI